MASFSFSFLLTFFPLSRKSAITVQFVQGVFVEKYDPTIEDSYRKNIEVDGIQCLLEILDTAGTEQFTAMNDIRDQIVRVKDTDNFPSILVGNKCDLEDQRVVSKADAQDLAGKWGSSFMECSAKTATNIQELFLDLIRQINLTIKVDRNKPSGKSNKSGGMCALL